MRALACLILASCSFSIGAKPTRLAHDDLECAGRTLPIIDTTMAGIGAAAITGLTVTAESGKGPGAGLLILSAATLVLPTTAYAIAGIHGFRKVSRCRAEARRLGG